MRCGEPVALKDTPHLQGATAPKLAYNDNINSFLFSLYIFFLVPTSSLLYI